MYTPIRNELQLFSPRFGLEFKRSLLVRAGRRKFFRKNPQFVSLRIFFRNSDMLSPVHAGRRRFRQNLREFGPNRYWFESYFPTPGPGRQSPTNIRPNFLSRSHSKIPGSSFFSFLFLFFLSLHGTSSRRRMHSFRLAWSATTESATRKPS